MASLKNAFRFNPYAIYGTQTVVVVNGTDDAAACVFRAPKSGNITYIGTCCYATPTGNPTFDCRLETVTSESTTPTGTLAGTGGNGTWTPTDNAYGWVALTTPVAVTAGNYYAAVVRGLSVDVDNYASVVVCWNTRSAQHPLALDETNDAWAIRAYAPTVAVKYSDGSIPQGMNARKLGSSLGLTPANEYEAGVLWTAGAAFDVIGAVIDGSITSGEFTVSLYNGATAERTAVFDGYRTSTSVRSWFVEFASAYRLTAANPYRLAVKCGGGTFTLYYADFLSTTDRDAVFGDGQWSQRTGTGSWSETATRTPFIVPIFNEVTGGGGLLVHPGMSGGLNG